jgi:LysR family glycine cleavage system transcriptional activator
LNTSQSSISRHIAELEAALGASLFERHKQRVHLSEQGKHLYLRVSHGLDSIRDGLQVIADWDADRPVTIGCTHAISHLLIMPVFDRLQHAMSDVAKVRVITSEYEALDAHLDPQIDIVFDYDVGNLNANDFVLLFAEAVKPVCAPGFKERHAKELSAPSSHWQGFELLEMATPNRGWANWEDWFADNGISASARPTTSFNNYVYLLEACASGRGLALGARGMVDTYLSNGRLVQAYDDYKEYDRGFYAVLTERGRSKSAAYRCLEALADLCTLST